MRCPPPAVMLAIAAMFLAPTHAQAQFAVLEKVLANVEDLSIYYLYGGFEPRSLVLTTSPPDEPPNQTGLNGFGFELSIGLFDKPADSDLPLTHPACEELKNWTEGKTRDTTEVTETVSGTTKTRSTKSVPIPKPEKCRETEWSGELAIGYSQLKGFDAQDTTFELRAALRELPSIALYVTYKPDNTVSAYGGIRSGLVQLHGLRAYDDSSGFVFSGSGSTFQAGIALGVVGELGDVNVFLEPSYNLRDFSSVEWAPVNNTVPAKFPRALEFDGWQLAMGVQIPLAGE